MKKVNGLCAVVAFLFFSSTLGYAVEKSAAPTATKGEATKSAAGSASSSAAKTANPILDSSEMESVDSSLPAPSPIPQVEKAQASKSEPESKSSSSTRAFRFGPTVALALPHPANIGIESRLYDIAGFAFTYGFMPSLTVSDVSVKMNTWDIRARLFPFRGAFFLGVAYGNQDLTGTRSENILGTAQSTNLKISTTTLTPHIGWRWGTRFVFGFDLGVQLAQSHKNTLTTSASASQQADPAYQTAINDLNKVADDIGSATLPFITVLHFGFMF